MNTKEEGNKILNSLSEIIVDTVPDNISEFYDVVQFNHYDYIIPSVVEPSIGIDRVFYTLICHNLFFRPESLRPCLLLTKKCRPYFIMLAQLSNHPDLLEKLKEYHEILLAIPEWENKKIFLDLSSTTIGKRYTRADELGIRYTVTIDFETLKDGHVTIRNSEDMSQRRVNFYSIFYGNYFES